MTKEMTPKGMIEKIDREERKSPSEKAWFGFLRMHPWYEDEYKTVNDENYQLIRKIFDYGYRYGMSDYGRRDVMAGYCAKCSDAIKFSVPKRDSRNDEQS